jgi:hypothetical protein
MTRDQARQMLLDMLAQDYVNTLCNSNQARLYVAIEGFRGFRDYSAAEMKKAAIDAGIDIPEAMHEALFGAANIEKEVRGIIALDGLVAGLKHYRTVTGVSLKEALDYCRSL